MTDEGVRIEFSDLEPAKDDVLFKERQPNIGLYNQVSKEEIRSRAPYQTQDWVDMVYENERDSILAQYMKELEALKKQQPAQKELGWSGVFVRDPKEVKAYEDALKALEVKYFGEK